MESVNVGFSEVLKMVKAAFGQMYALNCYMPFNCCLISLWLSELFTKLSDIYILPSLIFLLVSDEAVG